MDENKPIYPIGVVFIPVFANGKFISFPHQPFFEVAKDGSAKIGYRPLEVKWTAEFKNEKIEGK